MKYSINLGSTGYTRHMANSLLTVSGDKDAGLGFRLEVLFEGVPMSFEFPDTGITNMPENMSPEDWQLLSDLFDEQVKDIVCRALLALGRLDHPVT